MERPQFEYDVVQLSSYNETGLQDQLNERGAQGWELVQCDTEQQSYGYSRTHHCVFKRQIHKE